MQPYLPHLAPWEASSQAEILALSGREERLALLLQGDLDFHGRNANDPLHQLHPFPAKYPPQLPRLFIQHLTAPGEVVLDPMMGSGTTLLEAQRLRRVALGSDIDPLALTLVAAKSYPPSPSEWSQAWKRILSRAQHWLEHPEDLNREEQKRFDPATRDFLDYWFLPQTQRALLALTLALEEEPRVAVRRFARVVFSSLIIAKSGTVAQARDLSHTRPHRVQRPPKPVLELFAQKAQRAQRILQSGSPRPSGHTFIVEADAQRLPWADGRVALIVTSPPYAANAIDYMRAHKFSLVWWGYPVKKLGALRREYIGGEAIQGVLMEPLPPIANEAVQRIASVDAKKARVLQRYYSEMRRVLREMARVLQPGGIAILVVGDSTMRGLSTRTPEALAAIGEQVGLRHVGTGERQLDRDRRMMPARRGAIGSAIERRMHVEYVLGFVRPRGE